MIKHYSLLIYCELYTFVYLSVYLYSSFSCSTYTFNMTL